MSRPWHTLPSSARYTILAGAAALALLLWYLLPHEPALPPTASQRAHRPVGVTQLDYRVLHFHDKDSLWLHTTYAQAAAQFGEGSLVESSADGHTRTYQWNGGGKWARMEATFRDGYLVSKMQFLLREY
jgi:hypothetical protein